MKASASWQLREAGDSALVLEFEPRIDPDVNALAIGLADAIRRACIPGVRDVIPAYRSVGVFFDPLLAEARAIGGTIEAMPAVPLQASVPRTIEIPVAYGGVWGPDLPEVAAICGLSEDDVVRRHAAATYRVFMLGFMPGFPYMGSVDDAIAVPRKPSPRTSVPAGSVGIAGRQTGIYPRDTPGGWQIIGRSGIRLFDPASASPCALAPGDLVRFHSEPAVTPLAPSTLEEPRPVVPGLTVLKAGLLTTVQDLGRWGHQAAGVSIAGPMDGFSHRLANRLVGNLPDAATIEATIAGPELRIERPTTIAVCGADLGATLDMAPLPLNRGVAAGHGAVLRFSGRRADARAYVAFEGGLDVPLILGSRATHLPSGLGGLNGRALRAGDVVGIGRATGGAIGSASGAAFGTDRQTPASSPEPATLSRTTPQTLRVLPGPQADWFDTGGFDALEAITFTVTPHSNRMGYRLAGSRPVPRVRSDEMISDVTVPGAIQIPPEGNPILLMADRQTTGGYPQIAVVIAADLPLAGQLAPGDDIRFVPCRAAEALSALRELEARLHAAG